MANGTQGGGGGKGPGGRPSKEPYKPSGPGRDNNPPKNPLPAKPPKK